MDLRFTPESIAPGETSIMKLWGSVYYEYDEDTYDILQKTITIEPECGELNYIGGGEYLFTAPDTLTVDSIVVVINYENYSQACGESAPGTEKLREPDGCLVCDDGSPSLTKFYGSEHITIKWDSLYVEVNPTELFPGDTADVIIKKRLPDGTLTDFDTTQTYEAAMLEGCTLGNILVDDSLDVYFYDVNQPIKFVADTSADSTGLVLLRIGLVEETLLSKINNSNEAVAFDCLPGPPQTTKYKIVPAEIKEIKLVIIEPTTTTVDSFITDEPSMPHLNVKAKLEGYSGEFNFDWKYVISWTNTLENPNRTITKAFEGSEPGILSGTTSWEIDWEGGIIGGDNDTLFVSVFTVPRVYKGTVINPYRILGTNPTPQEVKESLTIHEQIVIYLESLPKWKQFSNSGFPIFGPPHGYGLMQLDYPRATDEEIWNWRVNKSAGQQLLAQKNQDALGYPNRVRRNFPRATDFNTDEQIWKEAHQRYRGGSYWIWRPNDRLNPSGEGEWIASPSQPHTRGEEAWEIYEDIQIGIYPPNWN